MYGPYSIRILNVAFMIYTRPVTSGVPMAPTRPGRPRSERARLAVLEAGADLLLEGGLAAATMEGIAARAGVSKVTIYKWWPTRGAVAVDSYFHRYRQTIDFEDTGDLARDLRGQIVALVEAFRGRAGEVMAEIIGQAQSDPDVAETLRTKWLDPRRQASTALVQRSIDRGEIRGDVDIQVLLDQIYAPIYFRLTMRHQPLEDSLAETLVRTVLDGVRAD
jgi:AcrR family transcriptional regulator